MPKTTSLLLGVIALATTAIAIRPYLTPPAAEAQSNSRELFIEPGVQMLRAPDGSTQIYGKVVVDLSTGKIWGFPTGTLDPYPSNPVDNKPITTHAMALGRFALEDTEK